MEPLGIVGLGSMGSAMVRRLVARGVPVVGTDLDAARRDLARDLGAETVDTLGEVLARCRTVLLSLPEGRHVRAVVEGPGGVIASNHPGTLVIDATTSEAATSRDLAAKCLEAGHAFIDAPVSGGPHGAAAGTLAIMVGGAAEDLERARPYLEHLAGNLVHVGASGAGNVAKLVNNLMAAAELVIAAEGMRLAVRAGIEPEALLNVVNSASGRSFCTEHVLPRMLERGGLDAGFGFSAGLMRKDVRLAIELAAATKTHMRLGEAAWKIWAESRRAVPDDADFSRLAGELIQHGHRITDT